MKNLILIPLALLFVTAKAQKSLFIQAGPTYSTYKNSPVSFGHSLGYFGGITYQDKFSKVLGVESHLLFMNQKSDKFSVRSVSALFAVNLYAGQSGFHFVVGPEVGHSLGYKFDGEYLDIDDDIRFAAVAGVGYPVMDKVSIKARYHYAIDDQGSGFDYNIQLGVAFKFFNR